MNPFTYSGFPADGGIQVFLKIMKYPGAKTVMLPDIRNVFLRSGKDTFVDVFGGSGLVSLNVHAPSTVYNDIDYRLVHIFVSLQKNPGLVRGILNDILFLTQSVHGAVASKEELSRHSQKYTGNDREMFNTLYRFTTSFGGMGAAYSTKNEKSKATFIKKVIGNLDSIERVVSKWKMENLDFRAILEKYNLPNAFLYLDPPYSGKKWYNNSLAKDDYLYINRVIGELDASYLMNIDMRDTILIKIFGEPRFVKSYRNENGKSNAKAARQKAFYTNVQIKSHNKT